MSDHVAGILPDWVPLAEAADMVRQAYQVDIGGHMRDLISDVRRGRVRHRVVGLVRDDIYRRRADPFRSSSVPGLSWSADTGDVVVQDWDNAGIDWHEGTVAGVRESDGHMTRQQIALWWSDLAEWVQDKIDVETRPSPEAGTQTAAATSHDKDDNASIAARYWMHGYALAVNDSGHKPKRDPTLKLCQQHAGVSYRVALAAWEALPPEWRNPPRRAGG